VRFARKRAYRKPAVGLVLGADRLEKLRIAVEEDHKGIAAQHRKCSHVPLGIAIVHAAVGVRVSRNILAFIASYRAIGFPGFLVSTQGSFQSRWRRWPSSKKQV
jgi:hypothetical protein